MSLTPVKFLWPYRLDPGTETSFTVEEQMQTAKFVLTPVIRLYNSSGSDVNLKITHVLDLGFGDDPLYSGTYQFIVVDEDVPSPALRDYAFTPQIDLDDVASTRHVVTVKNLDLLEERIVRFILFGYTDIQAQLPANQQIVRNRTT
jgi:hypothetical protein